ncbi:MAG: glutathione S-transferase [Pseudomonadota bacterium]
MAGLALESCANDVCPWTGRPVAEDALMRYRGQVIGFGDPRDRDRFLAAVVALETALAPTGAPKAP